MHSQDRVYVELVPITTSEFFGVEYSRNHILVGYKGRGTHLEQVQSACDELEDALLDRISDERPLVMLVRDGEPSAEVAKEVAVDFDMPIAVQVGPLHPEGSGEFS